MKSWVYIVMICVMFCAGGCCLPYTERWYATISPEQPIAEDTWFAVSLMRPIWNHDQFFLALSAKHCNKEGEQVQRSITVNTVVVSETSENEPSPVQFQSSAPHHLTFTKSQCCSPCDGCFTTYYQFEDTAFDFTTHRKTILVELTILPENLAKTLIYTVEGRIKRGFMCGLGDSWDVY